MMRVRAPRTLLAALALLVACDAPPPRATGDVAPPDSAGGVVASTVPSLDSLALLDSALIAASDTGAPIQPGGAVGPEDFAIGYTPVDPAQRVPRPEHVRAQIQATYDAGLTEWVLWNASSRYTPGALADANGVVPAIEGLAELMDGPDEGVRVPEVLDSLVPAPDTAQMDTAKAEADANAEAEEKAGRASPLGEPKDSASD